MSVDRQPIPVFDLEVGTVYEVNTRNLRVGVFTGRSGSFGSVILANFIGIRSKFDHRFLVDDEYGVAFRKLGRVAKGVELDTLGHAERAGERRPDNRRLRRSLAQFERRVER